MKSVSEVPIFCQTIISLNCLLWHFSMLSVINLIIRILKTGYSQNLAGQGPEQRALSWTCFEQGVRITWTPEVSAYVVLLILWTIKKVEIAFVILIYCLVICGIFWSVCGECWKCMVALRLHNSYLFKDNFRGNIYSKSRVARKWEMSCDRLRSVEALSLVLLSKLSE